jgi:hypothetical protein
MRLVLGHPLMAQRRQGLGHLSMALEQLELLGRLGRLGLDRESCYRFLQEEVRWHHLGR